jgi:type II restriction enzyme
VGASGLAAVRASRSFRLGRPSAYGARLATWLGATRNTDLACRTEAVGVVRLVRRSAAGTSMSTSASPGLALPVERGHSYTSQSQRARVMTEAWAESSLACPACGGQLTAFAANTRSRDFACSVCAEEYQLKAKRTKFGDCVTGAAYEATRASFERGRHPSFILLSYTSSLAVHAIQVIYRGALTPSCLIPRPPLSPSARRAGWRGCNIDLRRLPFAARIDVVRDGTWLPTHAVRSAWAHATRLFCGSAGSRGWMADVSRVVERLPPTFSLKDVYAAEAELSQLHPGNRWIRPKIRQQLQILRDMGVLRFIGPGRYSRDSS